MTWPCTYSGVWVIRIILIILYFTLLTSLDTSRRQSANCRHQPARMNRVCQPHLVHSPPGSTHFAHITSLQPRLLSHRLSVPSRFTAGSKLSVPQILSSSLSGSIWIAFKEFGLGPDLLGFSFVFCFFLFLATRAALRSKLTKPSALQSTLNSPVVSYRCL